jgi:hypothetical protein
MASEVKREIASNRVRVPVLSLPPLSLCRRRVLFFNYGSRAARGKTTLTKKAQKCHAGRRYEENHSFVRRISRDHRSDDSTSLRKSDRPAVRVRDADADSPKRNRSGDYGADKDGNDGGLFALHARRIYTDWRTVRSRHANSSAERVHPRPSRVRKDLKGDCIQRGMRRFIDRSRALLAVALTNCHHHIHHRARLKAANRFQGQNGSLIVMLRSSGPASRQRKALRCACG